jgi:hypothetical protein
MDGIFALVNEDGACLRSTNGSPCLCTSKVSALPGYENYKPVELNEKELYILEHTGYLPTVIER